MPSVPSYKLSYTRSLSLTKDWMPSTSTKLPAKKYERDRMSASGGFLLLLFCSNEENREILRQRKYETT